MFSVFQIPNSASLLAYAKFNALLESFSDNGGQDPDKLLWLLRAVLADLV